MYNNEYINMMVGSYKPNETLPYNNKSFLFWCRSLFNRATSVFDFTLPDIWQGSVKEYFITSLFCNGFLTVFNTQKYGIIFQPCNLNGQNVYYQPTECDVSNPALDFINNLEIGKNCELIKLTYDYKGICDIVSYYAEKLAILDSSVTMSLINNKFAYVVGAKNKAAAETLKKMFDKINSGSPAVFFDKTLTNDSTDKEEPWQFLERSNLKNSYITTDLLNDFQTLLNNFDAEVGIPTIPYQKKERLVQSEAESRQIDSTSRSIVWKECLDSSLKLVNDMFPELNISVKLRFQNKEGSDENVETNTNRYV